MADDIPASPAAALSEIEDADLWDDLEDDEDAPDGDGAQRKRRHDSQGSRDDVPPGAGDMMSRSLNYSADTVGPTDGGVGPHAWNTGYHGYGSGYGSSGYGSWYFQPGQGPPGGGAGGPPPHLAYWGVAEEPRGHGEIGEGPETPGADGDGGEHPDLVLPDEEKFTVYSSRWVMLTYMSFLNLLSDWTCYSVAPIAILTANAFGDIDPESLVTVFLGANAVASAAEPMILGRLGLRRTVLFGSLLLMIGSLIKSGGFLSLAGASPISPGDEGISWRLYMGFFLVGLSQPLYQCTPALLSASWFPENERTMATGVALNSNQLGIGFAFVFGTVLVHTEEDIIPYFGLLSMVATVTFIGTALQFEDAPPTPPSDTARVIKGDLVIKLPFLGRFGPRETKPAAGPAPATPGGTADGTDPGLVTPSNASTDEPVARDLESIREEEEMMRSRQAGQPGAEAQKRPREGEGPRAQPGHPLQQGQQPMMMMPPPPGYYPRYPPGSPGAAGMQYSPVITPQFYHGYDEYGHYRNALLDTPGVYDGGDVYGDLRGDDEGAEPIMTQLDHQLDIDIRDDQIVQQFRACFRRPGFAHCVVAFTTSGIVINTLSTYMDYLVTLNGAGREYVGYVGGTFQALIMAASLIFGGWTDHSRKYYFVTLTMLIFGAFGLSICNVNLDADAGGDLRLWLLVVAVLAGPLQPISTELGVEVVYPLSENTVLVIQQLFSNFLSAAFIPVFKALKDIQTNVHVGKDGSPLGGEVPQYTFSFYLLIVIHASATIYFATFNGTYLRYEAELEKKAKKDAERERLIAEHRSQYGSVGGGLN